MRKQESNINGLIITSIIINIVVTLSFLANPDYPAEFLQTLAMIMGGFILLSIIGVFLMSTGKFKLGSIIALVGFAVFVPIGLIGVFGVRKISDTRSRRDVLEKFTQ